MYSALYMWTSDLARQWVRCIARKHWSTSKLRREFSKMFLAQASERRQQALKDLHAVKIKQSDNESLQNYTIKFKRFVDKV